MLLQLKEKILYFQKYTSKMQMVDDKRSFLIQYNDGDLL